MEVTLSTFSVSEFPKALSSSLKIKLAMSKLIFMTFCIFQSINSTQIAVNVNENLDFVESISFILSKVPTIKLISSYDCEIANKILKTSANSFYASTSSVKISHKNIPALIVVESLHDFKHIDVLDENPKQILIIVTKNDLRGAENILLAFYKHSVIDVNFLVKLDDQISLLTFNPFDDGKCGSKLKLNLINVFDSRNKSWRGDKFYPSKATNLYRCKLNVAVNSNIPFTIAQTHLNGTKTFDGIEVFLVRELARDFNFVANFTGPFATSGFIFDNGTSTGALSTVFQRKNDLIIGKLSHQLDRVKYLTATTFFASSPVVIVMPPTPSISPFVKLYLPFTSTVWLMIISIFIIGCLVIIVTHFFNRKLYLLIVGEGVNYPALNLAIAAMGSSQTTLPRKNFPRQLLVHFLIFCLILRSTYQGRLFNILQKEISEKEPTTIDELVERNFVFYTYETLSERVHGMKFESR